MTSDSQTIAVNYITPSQAEGPYYPVEKLTDRDNDLLVVSGSSERPEGEVLSLAGVVYDTNGHPVEGAVVEIWQTDSNGVYLHPMTRHRQPGSQLSILWRVRNRTGWRVQFPYSTARTL
ncbi:MAG: hypothetical protein HC806_08560 [Anaerolineae bacterium]|nr:hypothetical protein [Anaerolineae bacterium]